MTIASTVIRTAKTGKTVESKLDATAKRIQPIKPTIKENLVTLNDT